MLPIGSAHGLECGLAPGGRGLIESGYPALAKVQAGHLVE
jgi:hypothetical protein